jgi:hypothetical protein
MAIRTIWDYEVGIPVDLTDPKSEVKTFKKRIEIVGAALTPKGARDHILQIQHPHAKWCSMPNQVTGEDLNKAIDENPVRKHGRLMRDMGADGKKYRESIPLGPKTKKGVDDDEASEVPPESRSEPEFDGSNVALGPAPGREDDD